VARKAATRQAAVAHGCVDRATDDLAEACDGADLIVLATPVGAVPGLLGQIAAVPGAALVTDVGSTKQSIAEAADALDGLCTRFVGAHPMAGSESTGPGAARVDLYEHRPVIITPGRNSGTDAIETIQRLWQGLGSRVVRMTPEQHDRTVARISHLPHALAVVLMNLVGDDEQAMSVASTGLADMTRLAGGDTAMWADIFLDNATAVLKCLEEYRDDLSDLCDALVGADRDRIEAVLMTGKRRREAWAERGGVAR
jgi:prephenate dehydrogenase